MSPPTDPAEPGPTIPRPLTADEHRAANLTRVYYATRCQNPNCQISTAPSSGRPNTTDFPNWPRMDTARCRCCLTGFVKQYELVGPEAVDAFNRATDKVVAEQKASAKKAAFAATGEAVKERQKRTRKAKGAA